MAWISFGALPLQGEKNLMTARVSMLLKSRASLTCFRACFLPGRAKAAPRYIAHAGISSPGSSILSALCFSSPFGSFSRDYRLPTTAPHTWGAKTLPRRTAPHQGTILWLPPTSPPTRRLRSSAGIWLQSWRWVPARYTWGRKLSVSGPDPVIAASSCSISPGSRKDSFLHLTLLTCFFKFARSHFVTLLSRRAQSGRWSSFVKRVWFTESHRVLITSFLLFVLFTQFIVDKMKKKIVLYQVKQLNHIILK